MTKKIRLGKILLAAVICVLPPVAVHAQNELKPDLVVTGIRIQWDKGPHPKKATVITTVRNVGATAALFQPQWNFLYWTVAVKVQAFYGWPNYVQRAGFRGRILPGESRTIRFDWTGQGLSSENNTWVHGYRYELCARVDDQNHIDEADEHNNLKCTHFTFLGGTFKSQGLNAHAKRALRLPSKPLHRIPSGRARVNRRPVLPKGGLMEQGVDLLGGDYGSISLAQPRPALCRNLCARESRCRAWTYVKPGIKGHDAVCYLKKTVPPPRHDNCCVSGVK